MKTNFLYILAFLLSFNGCKHSSEDTIDLLIGNLNSTDFSKNLTDTTKKNQIYILKYNISDNSMPTVATLAGQSEITITDGYIYFKKMQPGNHSYEISSGKKKESSTCNLNLFVIDNWPPVAVLEIRIKDTIVVIDPRSSYDTDSKWGGYLVSSNLRFYSYGESINLHDTLVRTLQSGKHIITLNVSDNEGAMSPTITKEITIP